MSRFAIRQIGANVEAAAGIPEGCELCGHCTVLRQTGGEHAILPCRGPARDRSSVLARGDAVPTPPRAQDSPSTIKA